MDFTYLQNFMDEMAQKRTPGNAVSVKVNGKEVFRYAAGFSDLENRIPMTGEESFYIYSCSKPATVTAALTLLEKGKLLLSDPLYEYIPEFRHMKVKTPEGEITDAKNPITVRHLFTMTAGFDYNMEDPCFKKAKEETGGGCDTISMIKCLADRPLCFEPGTHWQYSLCHDVLAGVVSVISGMKFRDYVKQVIFDPLDMQDTVFHATPQVLSAMAQQYLFVPEGGSVQMDLVEAQKSGKAVDGSFVNAGKRNHLVPGPEYDSGGAGIITTLSDYGSFLAALAHKGIGENGARILSAQTVELMRTNALSPALLKDYNWQQLRGYGYGLGVRVMMDPVGGSSLSPIGEFGWCGAAGSAAFIDPENGLSVFYVQHLLNPREEYYMPRLRNVIYACL